MHFAEQNVVVVARNFNVTILRETWLIQNGVLEEDEILPTHAFTHSYVSVETPRFGLLAIPDRIQLTFSPTATDEEKQRIIADRLCRLVGSLPHTPYVAVGLNFVCQYIPPTPDPELSRRLFFTSTLLGDQFPGSDARFGAYFSKDAIGYRLRLNALPITLPVEGPVRDGIQFAFNYHRDTNNMDEIQASLRRWYEANEDAIRIAALIEQRVRQ